MNTPITRLFDSHTEALAAVTELEAAGIGKDHISLIANNTDKWHDGDGRMGGMDRDGDGENDAVEGASKGAGTGALLGGGAGLLAGLGMLAIPGLGPVVAAGWLVSTAVGALTGAAAGGAAGGILGALKDAGHTDEDAHVYAEGVRRGGSLVSVKTHDTTQAATAERILQGRSGVTAADRMGSYKGSGWSQFDENATPYTTEQIAAQRQRDS